MGGGGVRVDVNEEVVIVKIQKKIRGDRVGLGGSEQRFEVFL